MDIDTIYPVNPDTLNKWEECCDAGRMAREQIDHWKFYIGDLACRIVTLYPPRKIGENDHTLAEFARDINVMKSSLYQYRQVSNFYARGIRDEFLETHPNLTWTHFRIAMSAGDVESAYEFLEECSAQGFTTDESAYHLSNRSNAANGTETAKNAPKRWQGLIVGVGGGNVTIKLKNDEYSAFEQWAKDAVEIVIQESDS